MAKGGFLQRLKAHAGVISAAFCVLAVMTAPVLAQFGNFNNNQRGNFDSFFTPFQAPRMAPERAIDYSKAPSPRTPSRVPYRENSRVRRRRTGGTR